MTESFKALFTCIYTRGIKKDNRASNKSPHHPALSKGRVSLKGHAEACIEAIRKPVNIPAAHCSTRTFETGRRDVLILSRCHAVGIALADHLIATCSLKHAKRTGVPYSVHHSQR